MGLRSWLLCVLAAVLPAGRLQAQERGVGVRLGLGGEWSAIPGRVDIAGVAGGSWGGWATLEVHHPALPRLDFVTRVGFAPERASPAAPQMTTLGAGVRLGVLSMGSLTTSTSVEVEGTYFTAAAYNGALALGAGWRLERDGYYTGWRGGMRLSPAVEFWPTGTLGFQFAPSVRWLAPVAEGGPVGNTVFVTFDVGMLFRLRP